MTRMLLAAVAFCAATANPVFALDLAKMNEAEKQAFGEAVREYLMTNPEVLIEAINHLDQKNAANEAENDRALVKEFHKELFDDGFSWVGGNPDGDLTIVEFSDYRCPYCRQVAPEVMKTVEKDGNIRLILKELPILGPESELATRFALAAKELGGDDAYKRAHDALMEMTSNVTAETLGKLAERIDLDRDAVIARMDADSITEIINKNRDLSQKLKISGTPTFVVGDQMLRGVPRAGMARIVEEIRRNSTEG